jgi:protein-disulfide isomerase
MKFQQFSSLVTSPLAIVVAGGLVAAAIYLGGQNGAGDVEGTINNNLESEAAISDIRPVDAGADHILGNPNASVTVIEYSDFECAFCRRFHPTMKRIIEEYPDDVRWVYRHFILGIYPESRTLALASECAGEQNRFWEMADEIFDDENTTAAALPGLARRAGVRDIAQFDTCVETEQYGDKVDSDTADAGVAGGRGTPYSVVIGPEGETFPISGAQPYAAVRQIIEQALTN